MPALSTKLSRRRAMLSMTLLVRKAARSPSRFHDWPADSRINKSMRFTLTGDLAMAADDVARLWRGGSLVRSVAD
jgi:hypothetical protein